MEPEHIRLETPIGTLDLVVGPNGLLGLEFADAWNGKTRGRTSSSPVVTKEAREAVSLLERYFAGERDALDRIPADPQGTPFQVQVWKELRKVPAGRTISYAGLAKRVGNAAAVRAVALCNARNPVALVIPCHRVIGSDGSLTGYGGGLDRKRWLLEHEGALLGEPE